MELIEKEKLYKQIKLICAGCKYFSENSCACCSMEECADAVADAPAVDAVPVVKCKDCKYRDPENKRCDCGCWHIPFITNDNDYCSYGEHRKSEK